MTDGNTWDGIEDLGSTPRFTDGGTMWFSEPARELSRDPKRADEVILTLDPDDMTCKFGFGDGDMFSDDIDVHGPCWLGHRLIERLCREAWPSADIWFVETCHNPVRCDDVSGLEPVDITMGQMVDAMDRATAHGDAEWTDQQHKEKTK